MSDIAVSCTVLPLLVTGDELLLADVLRLAAAAGVEIEVAHDSSAALRSWADAPAVLIGADSVEAIARHAPPRRDEVHVLARGGFDDGLYRAALSAGARTAVELPASERWLVDLLADAGDGTGGRAGTAYVAGVVGGCGGAGASTFACALATVAALRSPTLLMDLDPGGPGLDRVVGLDETTGVRWEGLAAARGRLGSRSLREALPSRAGLAVLTWSAGPAAALDPGTVRQVLSAGARGHDLVVVDLPRAEDEATVEVVSRCDLVLMVTGRSVAAVSSAGRVCDRLRGLTRELAVVVRAGRSALLTDQVGEALGLPVVAAIGHQRRLTEDVDLGLGPVRSRRSPLSRAARAVLDRIPERQAS